MKLLRKLICAVLTVTTIFSVLPLAAMASGADASSPTSYWNADGKFKIILDPSFGGAGTGGTATYNGVQYSTGEINYKIADAIKNELEQYDNVEVVMTRDADTDPGISAKEQIVKNNADADMLWTIWVDSTGTGSENGTHCDIEKYSCFTNPADSSTLNDMGKECVNSATRVMSAIDEVTGLGTATKITSTSFSSDTPYLRNDYWGMDKTAGSIGMPSLWFCFGDLTNADEAAKYFTNDDMLKEIGTAAARGLAASYGLTRTKPFTIALEAGWGPDYTGVDGEKAALNLKIAEQMEQMLQGYQDVRIIMCRTEDTNPPFADRVQMAIDQGADMYLALHTDSGSQASYDVYYSGDTTWDLYPQAQQLAESFATNAAALGYTTNVYPKTGWKAIDGPHDNGFIGLDIEHGDWAYDTSMLDTDDKIHAVAQADVNAVVGYFGLITGSSENVVLPDAQPDYVAQARDDGKLVLCLDPGHGGSETGAVSTYDGVTYCEKDLNLDIAKDLQSDLNEYEGVQVLMTRTDDSYVSLSDRTDYAKKNYADWVISLHNNAAGSGNSGSSNGSMVLVTGSQYQPSETTLPTGQTMYQSEESLGLDVMKHLGSLGLGISSDLGTGADGLLRRPYSPDGGASTTEYYPDGSVMDYYAIVRQGIQAGIPSILVEHAYMDNETEFNTYLKTADERASLAQSDADAIAEYFGLQKKPEYTEVDKTASGNFFKITTSDEFSMGSLDGLTVDTTIGDGALKLAAGETEGTYTSPIYDVSAFDTMVPTWDSETPDGTSVELQARVYDDSQQTWSSWLSWGQFGQTIQRGSTSDSDSLAYVDVDTLCMQNGGDTASKIQFQMTLSTPDAATSPEVRLISAALQNGSNPIPCISEYSTENLPDSVDLVGYPYSQGRRDVVPFDSGYSSIGGEICSMTTMTGLINLKGEDILPEELAVNFRDTNYGFGNWPYSVAAGASFGYEAYVRFGTWDLIKSELANGNAVGVSVRYAKSPEEATSYKPYVENAPVTTGGHLVLIRGYYTADDGTEMVLVNDSAVGTDAEAARAYRVDQFITGYTDSNGTWINPAWGGVCYILHAKDANAGGKSIQRVPATLTAIPDSTNSYGVSEFSVNVNGEKLSLPTTFTDYDAKTANVGQGGIITVMVDKADGSSLDGTVYPTLASKPATYGTVSEDGNILVDLSSLVPDGYTDPLKVTAYVIYNNGTTYVAETTLNAPDKSALQSLYNANKDKTGAGYTADSWSTFTTALDAANTTLTDLNANAAAVQGALTSLQSAIDGLAIDTAPVTIADSSNSFTVTGTKNILPEGTTLSVTPITSGNSMQLANLALADTLDADSKTFTLWNISLMQNGVAVEPDGTVTVSIPIPDGYDTSSLALYRIHDDGSKEQLTFTVDGGKLTFNTDHFSLYALVTNTAVTDNTSSDTTSSDTTSQTSSDTASQASSDTASQASTNPGTGDSGASSLPLAVLACGTAAGIVLLLNRRRIAGK